MSDEPFRFAISPVVMERNARRLIDIVAQFFPDGVTSKDLQIKFEQVTGLQRQSFYDTIGFAKYKRWLIGGGKNKLYQLNSDGSWKPTQTSAGEILEKDRLEYLADSRAQQIEGLQDEVERLRDWSSGGDASGADVALASLVRIVGDAAASERQRIRAAAAVLGYRTTDDVVTEFVKNYLRSVCESADIATDYRIEAGELLRRHEAPRVMSEIVRPHYRDDTPMEPVEPLADLLVRRRERQDRLEREAIEREMGLPPGGAADILDPTDHLIRIRRTSRLERGGD